MFKQIHKFFGSKEHKAKICGYNIGDTLLAEADEYPYPTFEEIYILGSKFMDMSHDGKLENPQIHDLGAILIGRLPARESDDQIILCSVGGMPVEDVAWGKEIYDYAKDHHIGTGLNLWEKPYLFLVYM